MKNISTHVTALLSGATSILAIIHPGFTVPPFVEGLVASLAGLAAVSVEAYHFAKTHSAATNLAAVEHIAATLATQATNAPSEPTPPAK